MTTTRIWVLDYSGYLSERLPSSTWIERLLVDGPVVGGAYDIVVECVERGEYVARACKLIRSAGGTVRLSTLSAARPALPAPPPSAFAGTLRPANTAPLLKSSNSSPWYTMLLSHMFLSTHPKQHLVLFGPPGCGKSLALDRARAMAVEKSVPHMFVSAAADGESEADMLLEVRQFISTTGAQSDALLVVDDIEAFARPQRAKQLFEMLKTARTRCVIVCNDSYSNHVRALHRQPERYRYCEAVRVADEPLDAHLQRQYPALPMARRMAVVADARGDVRAAQLAAEMEMCAVRRVAQLTAELAQAVDAKQHASITASIDALTRRLAMPVDTQQHGGLTGDILVCVRAKARTNKRVHPVVQQCTVLLQPRAGDAALTMQQNYVRLCGADELELAASIADDLSSAFAYKQSINDAMMADKFARNAPDDSTDENFKEQLLFDMSVVLPCVRASRAAVANGANRVLKLEFPEYALLQQARQIGKACRALDMRHEVVVRTVSRVASLAHSAEVVEERALRLASASLTTMSTYYALDTLIAAAGVTSHQQQSDDDDDVAPGAAAICMSIGELERTLFIFPLLLAGANMRDPQQRNAAIERCAKYGFDAEMYAYAALFYGRCTDNKTARDEFLAARATVLHQNHDATAIGRTEVNGTATTTTTVAAGGGGAVASKRKSVGGGSKAAPARKKPVVAVAPSQPTMMDKFVSAVKRSKGGDV